MGFWKINLFWKIIVAATAVILIVIAILGIKFLGGPEDAWLCQNGEWVKHGNPDGPRPLVGCGSQTQAEIIVDSPQANQSVSSPLTVNGRARGGWFFEASFPVKLIDGQGKILGQVPAQAQGDWMTTDFVPFTAEINYQAAATTTGKLVLMNDNPSGLPQNQKKFEIPVIITPARTIAVKAFFNNNYFDPETSCNKVFAVERRVAKTAAVARAALEQLLAGLSEQEKARGYFTSINPGVKIKKLEISGDTAKVDFDETLERAVGGSCRVAAIRAQITQTLKQFATIKNVIISINGRTEDILQP